MSELRTPPATTPEKVRVLCVDDEPQVLEGLALHLRNYEVLRAASGDAALELLRHENDIAVIVSDMRMPSMNGAAFLAKARLFVPDATRVLLTGDPDLDSAIAAINDGQIFRLLTKPCPSPVLLAAVDAAATHYRLVTAERVLLEQTLHGSIKALTDVLAITSPISFGRALRVKRLVRDLAERLELRDRWQVEIAAMLAPLGSISLPSETAERLYEGGPLTIDDHRMIAQIPALTDQLLASIPRLETVRAIIAAAGWPASPPKPGEQNPVVTMAHVLRVALDFVRLEADGHTAKVALTKLAERRDSYDPTIFATLEQIRGVCDGYVIQAVQLSDLKVGMVLAEDVKLMTGALLAAHGYEVTAGFVARAENFRHLLRKPLISVMIPTAQAAPTAA
jgi:CheY-like chemotaxis protein